MHCTLEMTYSIVHNEPTRRIQSCLKVHPDLFLHHLKDRGNFFTFVEWIKRDLQLFIPKIASNLVYDQHILVYCPSLYMPWPIGIY
uniref:Uncharacterized protein n=1 Tax=Lepeophtheirus salmonis TaxID=72036 RepID=A0A0K2TSM7_LEPSM